MDCSICNVIKDEKQYHCDSCKSSFHVSCAGISAREQQCLDMKKRAMSFYCLNCKNNLQLIPQFFKLVESLNEKFTLLSEKLETITTGRIISDCDDIILEKAIEEINDRKVRENNLIVLNIDESGSPNVNERIEYDKAKIRSIFEPVLPSADFKVIRLGMKNKGSDSGKTFTRPIKVILNSSTEVSNVLRNKYKLNLQNIKVKADLTIMQRNKFKAVYTELNARKNAGEQNLMVKFINGLPKIVNKTPTNQKN